MGYLYFRMDQKIVELKNIFVTIIFGSTQTESAVAE